MVEYIVALITGPSKEVGTAIARALLEQKLAACVNIVSPINSLYTWKGETCSDKEVLLVVKTKAAIFEDKFIPAVQAVHPYEVPEIIALPIIMGSKSYLDWIDAEVRD
jgi:periplasmic divalent cation tolerance protein